MFELIADFWAFLIARKKLFLLPLFILFVLLGFLIVMAQGSAVAPFIYSLF
jgi:hypothetical protein